MSRFFSAVRASGEGRHLYAPVVVICVALLAQAAGLLDPLDRWLGDLRFRIGERPASGQIVIADIDSRSLHEIGTWPWPRSIHAELIDRLRSLGAAEIALDIDFSTASNPSDDAALEAALARAGGSVILASFAQSATGQSGDPRLSYNVPIAPFLANAWTAAVNVLPDADGKVRDLPLGAEIEGAPTQSLAAMLANFAAPASGQFPVDFSIRPETVDRISIIDVLRGKVDPSRIGGKKVIVGANAVELHDLFQVPVYSIISGSLLQALGAETLIQGRLLASAGAFLTIVVLVLIVFACALIYRGVRWVAFLGCLAVMSVGIEFGAGLAQLAGLTILHTAVWQVALAGFAVFAIGSEIDFRRILLLISRTETRNVRTVLDQVIADNFAGIVVVGKDGLIRTASRSASLFLGLDEDRPLTGETIESVVPAELARATHVALEYDADDPPPPNQPQELRYTDPEGALRILEYVVTPSRLAGGVSTEGHKLPDQVIATLTYVDFTKRRLAEERVAYLARFDTLTGLANRNQFEEKLYDALKLYHETGESCAVLFFDLDRFKGVNDTLGHDFGDRLLTAVARRLEVVVRSRPHGDTVARFGGDEYAVLMAGPVTANEAALLAARLITTVGEPFELDGHRLIVGLSVGIALPQGADATVGTLMKNADAALYRAKGSGGGTHRLFDASIETAIRRRRELEVELWDAFERDEFEVYYQPQVDLADRRFIGVEALLRWCHPERGYVSPMEFVPVAEAVGLIEPLGGWILQQACKEVARWPGAIKLAVNVSPVQFVRGDLVKVVTEALVSSGLPPARLSLEITESLFLQENRSVGEIIDRLRALGVSFAIDDFGTGYSSLSYMRKFPVQKIKIDQSFVRELPHDRESAAIVRAVCTLAQGLDIAVNAEGVEREEQAVALRLFGCHEGQGYLFGRPEPATEIIRLLDGASGPARRSA